MKKLITGVTIIHVSNETATAKIVMVESEKAPDKSPYVKQLKSLFHSFGEAYKEV